MIMNARITAVMAAEEVKKSHGLRYLKERRICRGLSLRQTAELVGVTPATYAYWERAKGYPSSYYMPLVAEVLRCSIEELYLPVSVENVFHLPEITICDSQEGK